VGIVNRRNAVLGWVTWELGKRVAREKAKSAVPGVQEGRPNKGLILSVVAGVAAALVFWRRSTGGDEAPE